MLQNLSVTEVKKVNEGNKYFKQIKDIFSNKNFFIKEYGKWIRIPKKLSIQIIRKGVKIHETREINIQELLNQEEYENVLKYNAKRLNDDKKTIRKEYVDEIILYIENYYYDEFLPKNKEKSTFDYEYVDYEDFDDDFSKNAHLSIEDDIIYPSNSTTYMGSVLRNLFYNKDIKYAFSHKIPKANSVLEANEIKTGKFSITTTDDYVDIPTKYKIICRAKTKYGECGNIVYFNETHLFNTLKCNLNNKFHEKEDNGHTILKPEKISAWESRRFYCYTGRFISGSDDERVKEITIYSLHLITQQIFEANFLYVNSKNYDNFVFIVGLKHEIEDTSTIPTIIKNTGGFVLSNLFDNLKIYYKEHHNIMVKNDNQIVAHFIILLNLCKIYFNHKYIMATFGASGSGKTFFSRLLAPMFSFKTSTIKGTNISEAGFLGGKSNISGLFGKSVWKPGLIETNDFLTIDEATELLESFADEKNPNKNSNIYYLIKLLEDGSKRGIMGAETTNPNASMVLFGNLESLTTIGGEYRRKVASKYRSFTDSGYFNNNWSLYRPIRYYIEELDNLFLAKAHAYVRMNNHKSFHYITNLSEPNQGRIAVMLCLEQEAKEYVPYDFTNDEEIGFIHRKQFLEELDEIFKGIKKPDYVFKKKVHDYIIKDYFLNEENNFITHPHDTTKRQLFTRVVSLMTDMVWLNKHWSKKVNDDLTDEDKAMIRYYMRYNYNVLNQEESSMKVHPRINNISFTNDELDKEDDESKRRFFLKKQKEREESKVYLDEDIPNTPTSDDVFS